MTTVRVEPAHSVQGEVVVGGDKSISIRALLLATLSTGTTVLDNVAPGDDVRCAIAACRELGATLEESQEARRITVQGIGLDGLPAGDLRIDAGNSGTLARLMCGIATLRDGVTTIVGDASLSERPMERVAAPLRALGARIATSAQGTLPVVIAPGRIEGGEITIEIASAQVATAIMFAALGAQSRVALTVPAGTRDHTRRLFTRAGVRVGRTKEGAVTVSPGQPRLPDTRIACDTSAAAPLLVAAAVLPGSYIRVPDLTVDAGRTGLLDLLERMRVDIALSNRSTLDGEPVADVEVRGSDVQPTAIPRELTPTMIDEIPLLGILWQFCRAESRVGGAGELRLKEADRITHLVQGLHNVGIAAQELRHGFVVRGSGVRHAGGTLDAVGDHRLAMLGGIAGLTSRSGVEIEGADCVSVSFPDYFSVLEAIAVR